MSESLPTTLENGIFDRLHSSRLFARFEEAFRSATGLPLRFLPRDEEWCISEHRQNQSPFCEIINRCETACEACLETNRKLIEEAMQVDGPKSCGCFSGMSATAVPVKLGKIVLGFLKTGQVFQRQPTDEDFSRVLTKLRSETEIAPEKEDSLRTAFFETRTVDPKRYDSMVILLNMFAEQLSEHAETISITTSQAEPEGIARARRMIHQNLEDPIELDEIAKAAGMSKSHFCRTFKEVTSMTVTEYTTRARITWARKELLRPSVQISEVAYHVGFQSLSQFNRSFSRIVGMSPSAYRKTRLAEAKV